MKRHKFKPDSLKCTQVSATSISFPKGVIMEKLGLKGKEKMLDDVLILYKSDFDEDCEEEEVVGLQFNFINAIKHREILKEDYIKKQ